jgi:hypothetical protein
MLIVVLFNILLVTCAVYAFARGGAPERVVAAAFVAAAAASYAVIPAKGHFHGVEVGLLLIDAGLLAVLTGVALRANRFWPIWIASFQMFALLVHVARAYQEDVLPIVYFAVISRIAYPMLLMLAIGTARHFWRVRHYGEDADWCGRLA